jgi:hypothetical protein
VVEDEGKAKAKGNSNALNRPGQEMFALLAGRAGNRFFTVGEEYGVFELLHKKPTRLHYRYNCSHDWQSSFLGINVLVSGFSSLTEIPQEDRRCSDCREGQR